MNHIQCLYSIDPCRRMQGVNTDFGVDVAAKYTNRRDFFEYITRFSSIEDDELN